MYYISDLPNKTSRLPILTCFSRFLNIILPVFKFLPDLPFIKILPANTFPRFKFLECNMAFYVACCPKLRVLFIS